ncbi:hypothetical protein [Kitasatospora sp. NPDC096140]|uniref:hypothetical protein n=1 Tax=Kitasatospora sp. NPDC096140 TaxID=3155425 RepID=UPI003326F3A9
MQTPACADCGNVPEQAGSREYSPEGQMERTRRPGGLCRPCHEKHPEQQKRKATAALL